jgi:predicted MFS family arabinose efflux permease
MYFVAIVTILSGFLFMLNEYLPFLCTTILYVIALFISLFFTDIKVEEEEEELKLKDYFILSIKSIKENKRLRWLMIAGSFFTIFFINQNVLLQQYMSDIKFNVSLFGIVFFLYNMLTAFVSKRSDVLEKKFGKHTKVVFTLLIAVCFISAGFAKSIVGIVILALCRVSVATINPIILTEVNDQIGSRNRATLLSFYNAVTSIADSLFSPIIGFGIDGFGIFSTYIILGLCGFVFVFFLLTEKVTCMSSDNLSSHNNY